MWTNRKARFTVILTVIVAANLFLWLSHKILGYTIKDHGALYGIVYIFDITFVFGMAILGFITTFVLAFKPEALKRSIEQSMAKQAARRISN